MNSTATETPLEPAVSTEYVLQYRRKNSVSKTWYDGFIRKGNESYWHRGHRRTGEEAVREELKLWRAGNAPVVGLNPDLAEYRLICRTTHVTELEIEEPAQMEGP